MDNRKLGIILLELEMLTSRLTRQEHFAGNPSTRWARYEVDLRSRKKRRASTILIIGND